MTIDPRDKRIAELEAQVRSLIAGKTFSGYASREEQPDDTPFEEEFEENGSFGEDVFTLADKYDIPCTNNSERWVDGQYLRHIGELHGDIERMCRKWLIPQALKEVQDGTIDHAEIARLIKTMEEAQLVEEIRYWLAGFHNQMRGDLTEDFIAGEIKNLYRLLYSDLGDEFLDRTVSSIQRSEE